MTGRHVSFSTDTTASTHPRNVDIRMDEGPRPSHDSMPSTSSSVTERPSSPGSPDIPLASVVSQRSQAQSSWSDSSSQHMSAPAALPYPAESFTIPSQYGNPTWQHQPLGSSSSLAHALSPPSHTSAPSTSTFVPSAYIEPVPQYAAGPSSSQPTNFLTSWRDSQQPQTSDPSQQPSTSWTAQDFDLVSFLSSGSTTASQPQAGVHISPQTDFDNHSPDQSSEWFPLDMAYDWAAWLDAPEPLGFITDSVTATVPDQPTSSYQAAPQSQGQLQSQEYVGMVPPQPPQQQQQSFSHIPDLGAAWYNGQLVSGGLPNPGMVSSTAARIEGLGVNPNPTTPMDPLPQAQGQAQRVMPPAPGYMPPHHAFGASPPAAVIQSSAWVHMPPIQYPVPSFAPGGSSTAALNQQHQQQHNPMSGFNVNAMPSSSSKPLGPYDHIKRPSRPLLAECMTRDHQATLYVFPFYIPLFPRIHRTMPQRY